MKAVLIIHNGSRTEIYKDELQNLYKVIDKILPNHSDCIFELLSPFMYEKKYFAHKG